MKRVCYVMAACALLWLGPRARSAEVEAPAASGFDQAVAAAAAYESGHSLEALRQLENAVRESCFKPIMRAELEAALIQLLGTNATFEARKFACKQLGIIGSRTALPALEGLLADPETAGIACLALTTYPSGKADELLRAGLRFATGPAQVQIINTLGDRRDPDSVPLLAPLAAAADPTVAEAAIASLGKIGTPAAWKAIRQLRATATGKLTDPLTDALLRCAEKLRASGRSKAAVAVYEDLLANADNVAVRRSALAMLLASDADEGEKRILEVLSGADDALKPMAIARMSFVTSPGASEAFAAHLHHLKPEQQVLLVENLAVRGDAAALLVLAKSLSLPNPMVRRAAIAALGQRGDPYFIGLLATAAGSASGMEEAKAVEAALAGMKGGAETDRKLVAQLKLAPPKARVPIMAAIVRRQGAAATETLLEETDNLDPAVAKAAFRALAKVGTAREVAPVLVKLVTLQDAGVRTDAESTAAQLLAKMPDSAQRSAAVSNALARATTLASRNSCLALLPACGDATALAAVKIALSDSELEVRESAVRALSDWPNDAAWDELLAVYRKSGSEKMRGVALRGLARLLGEQNARPDATLIDRYRQVLSSAGSEADYKLILGVVADAAHPEALSLVLPLLSNTVIRTEASLAAHQIIEAIRAQHPQVAEEALKQLQAHP